MELKLKVFDKLAKYYIDDYEGKSILTACASPDVPDDAKDRYDFLLFTGILDKNGKEIYANDELTIDDLALPARHNRSYGTEVQTLKRKVVWDDEHGGFGWEGRPTGPSFCKSNSHSFELKGER